MATKQDLNYWEKRYYDGGHSGYGSKGDLLKWKAEVINGIIKDLNPESIVEIGCGDGNLAALLDGNYTGYDIAPSALTLAKGKRKGKFVNELPDEVFDLALSIDVIHHITDKQDLKDHLKYLKKHKSFIIYAPIKDFEAAPHCKSWDWRKMLRRKPKQHIENKYPFEQYGSIKGSRSEFFVYGN